MSEEADVRVNFMGLPLLMFVLIKVAGTSLADWSWWLVLLPIIPDLAFVFGKLGWSL